jgi:hypothetical protein
MDDFVALYYSGVMREFCLHCLATVAFAMWEVPGRCNDRLVALLLINLLTQFHRRCWADGLQTHELAVLLGFI